MPPWATSAPVTGVPFRGEKPGHVADLDASSQAANPCDATSGSARSAPARAGPAIGHVIMTMGIVVVAAGIADAIHHLGGHAQPWLLGGGAATFLAGHAVHRAALGSGRIIDR